MPFFVVDLIVGGVSLCGTFLLSLYTTFLLSSFVTLPPDFAGLLKLFFFLFSMVVFTALYGRLVNAFLPMKEGTISLATNNLAGVIWKLQGFMYLFNLSVLVNTYLTPVNLRWLVYRLLGSKIGRNVIMCGKVIEPLMIEIGDYTMLGEDSLVTGHSIEGEMVTLGRVQIGNHVTVGVKAVIFPNVDIGDHALIAAGAVVRKGTKIGRAEIWGGIPAKKLGSRANQVGFREA